MENLTSNVNRHYRNNSANWFLHSKSILKLHSNLFVILIYILLHLSSIDSFSCVFDKCDCMFISGKQFASCVAHSLEKLPQCQLLDLEEKSKLHKIQAINLTQNHFAELTPNFFSNACLENLQKIYVQQVGLKVVDDQAFTPLKNVIELSLSLNSLTRVPSKSITNLVKLRFLDLSYNNIKEISNDSFKNLADLQTLLLNNNEISHLEIESFSGLTNLRILKLNSNRLTVLHSDTFLQLKKLHSIYLESNSWNCNCRMQPFMRMLLLKSNFNVLDQPRCNSNSAVWSNLALENFQCAPVIFKNFSDSDITISEGSTLRLKCAIFIETFGDSARDEEYFSFSNINWYWNNMPITNNSKGCDHNCKNIDGEDANSQHFQIHEYIREYNNNLKLKISNLELYSIMTLNEGNYRCSVANTAGSDQMIFQTHVIPYYTNKHYDNKIAPAASSFDSQMSYNKNIIDTKSENHILFGLVLGILCGIFIVLVIFSIVIVVFFRRQKIIHLPHELAIVDVSTDNNTVDENNETNTETTEKLNVSQAEFNPLLMVNPVQKPPRLGIPDVSSIYSNPSWTMDRANYNRSRYASYAETEPLYTDYYTLYRNKRLLSRLDNRTFISDTASEV